MKIFVLSLALLAAPVAYAQTAAVRVDHPWARATAPHAPTGAVYFTLTSPAADRLVSATSPASDAAELHETTMTSAGVMQMRPVAGLDLPAGKPVTLSPGKYHLMLTGLKAPLVAGHTLSVHLTFEHAPPLDVTVPIEKAGAAGPGMGDMPGMKM